MLTLARPTSAASLSTTTDGAVTIHEASATELTGANTSDSLLLVSAGAITDASGASVTIDNGDASISGTTISLADSAADTLSVSGTASFDSGAGAITIAAAGAVNFGSLAFNTTGGAVAITEDSSTTVSGASTAGADLALVSADDVTLDATVGVTGNVTVTAGTSTNGTIDVNAKLTGSAAILLDAADSIIVDAAIDPVTVTLLADDDITINAPVQATMLITVSAGQDNTGSVVVDGSGAETGSLTTTDAGSDITIMSGSTTGGITLDGDVTTVERLTLTSDGTGDITQPSGTISAAELQVTAVGDVTLNQATNDVTTLAVDLNPGTLQYTDANSVTVGTVATSGITTGNGGDGGAVTINATAGTITVDQAITTSPGTGGGISVSGAVAINAALTAAGGTITLNGDTAAASDLDINANLTSDQPMVLTAVRDIFVRAQVQTAAGSGSNITLTADSDGDGVGGVRIETAGQIDGDGNVQISGSDLFVSGGTSDAVEIESDGAVIQVLSDGNISIGDGPDAPADATTIINGAVQAAAAGGAIAITAEDDVTLGAFGDLIGVDATITITADSNGDVSGSGGAVTMTDGATIDAGSGTIDLRADEDITISGLSTTNASGAAVTITSNSGGVVDAGDTNLDITANSGTVVIDAATGVGSAGAIDTQIATLDLDNTASGNVDVNETDSLNINELDQDAATGTVNVDAGGTITIVDALAGVSAMGGQVELDADGVDSSIAVNATISTTSGAINVLADDDVTFDATSSIASTSGNVTIIADANAGASGTDGALLMTDGAAINAGSGTIGLGADEDITISGLSTTNSSGTAVTITSASGGVVDAGDTNTDVTADSGTAVITASTGIGATAGSGADNAIETMIATLDASVTSAGAIDINETNAIVLADVDTADGPISVDAGGQLTASDVQSTTDADANDITLTTTSGDILVGLVNSGATAGDVRLGSSSGGIEEDGTADAAADIVAHELEMIAADGIADDAQLEIDVTNLAATTTSGDVHLQDTAGGLTITDVNVDGAGAATSGVSITGGAVADDLIVRAGGLLTVDSPVRNTGGGDITLASEGTSGSDDLDVNGNITAGSGSISLYAGDAIGFDPVVEVSATGSGDVLVSASTNFNDFVTSGDLQNGTATGNINMQDGSTVKTEDGDITLRAAGDVILSKVDADSNNDSTLATEGIVVVTADFDGVDGGLANNSGAITDNLSGDSATDINVKGGSAALRATTGIGNGNALETGLAAVAADNSISGNIEIDNHGGGLLTIGTVDGLSGVTNSAAGGTVVISNASPLTVDDDVTAVGDITLTATDVAGSGDDLTVSASDSAGTGTVEIESTGANVTLQGGDDVLVSSGSTVEAAGKVTIQGDFGHADSLGSVIEVFGKIITVTQGEILGEAGNDSIDLNPDAGSTGSLRLDGQSGDDSYVVQFGDLGGIVNVDDQASEGTDDLTINGTAGADTLTVGAAQTTDGATQTVTYTSELEFLDVRTLDGADTINVTPSVDLEIDVLGGNPTSADPAPRDTLNLNTPAGSTTTLSGLGPNTIETSGGFLDITFDEIEDLTLAGVVTVIGTDQDDVLEITATGPDSGSFVVTSGGVAGPTFTFSSMPSFTFNAGDGSDELIIDNTGGLFQPTGGIFYDGQGDVGDSDVLTLIAGSVTDLEFDYTNLNDGFVNYDGTLVLTYTGLEPITSTITATNVILDYSAAAETITVTDAGSGSTTASSTAGETTTFTHPTGTLTINAGDTGDDTIDVDSLAANYPANIVLDGEGGADTVNLNGTVSLGIDKSLTVTNADTINLPNVTSDVSTSGSGTVSLTADRNIDLDAGSSITTDSGDITLVANSSGTASGNFAGVELDDADVMTTSGSISLTGTGGDTGINNHGVFVDNGATVQSTGEGAGDLTFTGTAGNASDGVHVDDATSEVSSVSGNIQFIGNSDSDEGVQIIHADVNSTGSATITITGTTTNIGSTAHGVSISESTSAISSASGNVQITGNSAGRHGVLIASADVTSTSTATITINGTTSSTASNAEGVLIDGSASAISSVSGNIQITGNSAGDDGVEIAGADITSTGTATITITGTTTSNNGADSDGVVLAGSGARIASSGGAISITGTTAGGGTAGDGIEIEGGVTLAIDATDAATITLSGTGDGVQSGVQIDSPISSGTGSVTVRSENGDSTTDDIQFGASSDITSTSGTILIDAVNGGNTADVLMADGSFIDSGSGAIDVDAEVDVTLGSLITSGDVTVDAASGSILDGGDTDKDIIAATALLAAAGNIGTGANPLETDIDKLEATAGATIAAGGIWIENMGGIELGGVDGGTSGILADGTIEVVDTSGSIAVSEKVESQNAAGTNSVTLDAATTIDIDASVLSANGPVTVDAGTDLAFAATGLIDTEAGSTGLVDIDAGGMIDMADGSFVDAWSGAIEMNATGDIAISLLRSSDRSTVVTTGGAVTDADGGTGADVNRLGTLIIDAAAGIATGANPLDTEVTDLEAHGGSGGIWVINTGGLTIDDLDAGIALADDGATADADIVITATSPLTVAADVVSSTGDILLTATDSGVGDDLEVLSTFTVEATAGTVTLRAGDDLTLEDSSTVRAGSTITLLGDFGNTDPSVGTTISLFGTLDASGTSGSITVEGEADDDLILVRPDPNLTGFPHSADGMDIDGKGGDDTYHIWNGRLNGGAAAVNVIEAGPAMANDDLVIVEGTNDMSPAGETFNVDGQSGGTVENTTHSETVSYTSSVERLIVRGNLGNDTFTGSAGPDAGVEPSLTTIITIDGGDPGFGDSHGPGGSPDGPGDVMFFDPLNNVFEIIGKAIFTDGDGDFQVTGAADYKGVSFRRIEALPLMPPATTPELRFDFDGPPLETQAGYTSVAPGRLYGSGTPGSDFGWVNTAPATVDRGNVLATTFDDLLQDAHFLGSPEVFRADVMNGWHLVSIKIGDTLFHDQIRVTNADNGQILLDGVGNTAGQFAAPTFAVQVVDGTLDLEISDLGGDPSWVINALEIRPGEILTFGSPDPGTLVADGFTEDTFLGFEATPGELITISASIDVTGDDIPDAPLQVVSPDADPHMAGVQVLASSTGTFSYTIRRPSARGTAFVKMEHFTGTQTGCLAIDYVAPSFRRFDFNNPTSPTQVPEATPGDSTGYAGVLPTELYRHSSGTRLLNDPGIDGARGYGWTDNVGSFDRGASIPVTGAGAELRRDAHFLGSTQTFAAELAPGTYLVNVTLGDTAFHDNVEIRANGALVPGAVTTNAGQWVQKSFTVSIGASGLLDLEFTDTGGDPTWVVNGIEMRELSLVGAHTLTPDGTGTTISGSGATPLSVITVKTTLGSIASPDEDPNYDGVQVTALGDGTFSFLVTPPFLGGAATLSSHEVTGAAAGSTIFTYAAGTSTRFDLNGTGSPTAAGFVGIGSGTANAYTAAKGVGWQTGSGTFDRFAPTDSLRDGHYGTDNTFLVDIANGDYIVNITLGDAAAERDLVDVYAEGALVLDNITAPIGQYVHRSFPVTLSDGQLTLRFDDDGGDPLFAVNAIEVVSLQAAHSLSPDGAGTTITGAGATPLSLITVSTTLGTISSPDADPNYAGVQVNADSNGDFSFAVTAPTSGGPASITSEEVTGLGIGSTTFAYGGLGPAVQICDNEDGCFSAPTFTLRTTWGFQSDVRFAAGDSSGDTATWTFTVEPGFDYRVSAYWRHHPNRATNAPYEIFDGTALPGNSVGTASVNQRVATTDVVYTRVFDSGVWFADLGAPYTISGSTLTVTLDDAANGYVIADGIRIERLEALRAETAILDASSVGSLTLDAAAPLVAASRAAWSLADAKAAARLSGVEVIVTDLPGTILGLASEPTRTIWLDTNAAGHGLAD